MPISFVIAVAAALTSAAFVPAAAPAGTDAARLGSAALFQAISTTGHARAEVRGQLADAREEALADRYTPAYARAYARDFMKEQYGWGDEQFDALVDLWTRESNWDYTATNTSSGAYGIPQALPGHKMASAGPDWRTSPEPQIRWGLRYIQQTYGSPSATVAFWNANGWY